MTDVNLTKEELDVIEAGNKEMSKCTNRDSINKVYRQLRTWNRWHSLPGYTDIGRDYETYIYINTLLKNMRWAFLSKLEEVTNE